MELQPIPNYNNYYASTDGRIWSGKSNRFLKLSKIRDGHLQVPLGSKNQHKSVHRLILETFIGPCPEGMECRHLNGDSQDNRLENLKWGTHSENVQDAVKHKTHVNNSGSKNGLSKLIEEKVKLLRIAWADGWSAKELSFYFNIYIRTVYNILNRDTWKHI